MTIQRARDLRSRSTLAEKTIWKILCKRKMEGYKFRRQHPFGNYVLDFYCAELRLCIEMDGSGHAREVTKVLDYKRTELLQSLGLIVIRYWNNEVLNNMEGVHADILRNIKELKMLSKMSHPHPDPLPNKGEGIKNDSS